MPSGNRQPVFASLPAYAIRMIAGVVFTFLAAVAFCLSLGIACGQILQDQGSAAPNPGFYDLSQLSTSGNQTAPDGLNYYTDDQTARGNGEPGQTFTTGTNSAGYTLTSIYIKTAGLGSFNGISTLQPYYLHIYSVTNGDVTLQQTYTSANMTFNDGDWLQWTGLAMPLEANSTYAYSFGKASSTTGWEALAVASGNPYPGGEIGLIPPAGGSVKFGSSHGFDAVFDVGLIPTLLPAINQLSVSPTNQVLNGTVVTLEAGVSGAMPLYLQWQFNNGGGSVNLPDATTNLLIIDATLTNTGIYQLVVTNSYGATTSAPVPLLVTLDNNPPVVLDAYTVDMTNVELDFCKPLDPVTAANISNYAFTSGLAITSATLSSSGTSVLLTTAPLSVGSNYLIVINGLRDQALPPNTIPANSQVAFVASPRNRICLDNGWHFQLGDPVDVTTNVTWYPEIADLAKLDASEVGPATNTASESYMEAIRVDPVATHAGENVSFVQTNYSDSSWRSLNLPHDWVVELPFSSSADGGHGFKSGISGYTSANTIAWYRHTFALPANAQSQSQWLEFDGVYRNCLVWLNGHILGRNVSGYSSFYFDVTPYLNPGGTNVLVVRVDASRFEGWFYEGAGIYRHVWLTTENPVHVAEWGTYVATTSLLGSNATITVQTEVTNQSPAATINGSLTSTILDANSNMVATINSPINLSAGQDVVVTQTVNLANANLWSLGSPYLYNLATTISNQNAVADLYNTPFGIRTVSIDSTNGVSINGQHVWIQGMCNHQDMAGVGSALPDRLQYYRIERLKQMGANGYRSSHNEPTPELLNACDQLGMLVLDENRRVGTNTELLSELSRQIRRDRNHPSVFMWSLANEEPLQGTSTGASIMQVMQNFAHSLDGTRLCTAALNSWGSGFSSVLDVNGFNYQLGQQDTFHSGNPQWPIIGTETSSLVSDRGIYTNDAANGYVWGYDVENSAVNWGETAEAWWQYYFARPWSSGGFSWTGFDYRGEPTPYGWPCINSHFGSLDTCGFPKDNFYYYQANWTLKPVLHVFPHWNWPTTGQPVNIWAFGNCQTVELFTNGVSLGRQTLDTLGHVEWDNVPYVPGTLQAIGYNFGMAVITNTVSTTGVPATIALIPDRSTILADGRDVSVVAVQIHDPQGNVVPTATNLVNFNITGGSIIGVANGDPSSHQADKASNQRSAFNGLAEVLVQSSVEPGPINLTATAVGLPSNSITITAAVSLPPPASPGNVVVVGGNGQLAVSWDIVPGASTYNLWRSTNSGGPYKLVAGNLGGVNLGYVDSNVINLITYYYVVTANGAQANGTSAYSAEASGTPSAQVTGLAANATNDEILLNWNATAGAEYNVKRSTEPGGPYLTLASAIAGTNFTDANVVTCQSYFYVVTLTNGNYESLPSLEVTATLPGTPPPQFTSADIGAVGFAGSAYYCNGEFTISGSGGDIWYNSDAFQFDYVYVPVTTNCDVRVRVLSVENTSSSAKAGVMIRESLAANSSHVMADVEAGSGIEFIWRNGTGTSAGSAVTNGSPPAWVRLTRTNNTFTAYSSTDGKAWMQIGAPTNINMAVAAYIGLAVCAHNNNALNTCSFTNLSASFLPANTPPVLASLGNQIVNVGQTVTQMVEVTDTNIPPPMLTFSLLNAPASATLLKTANESAAFTWRPGVPDADTTNSILLKVADNGLPVLSATQNFLITVNPLARPSLSSFGLTNDQFTFQLNGQVGPDLEVQVSTNLFDWSNLFIANSPAMPWTWTDTNQILLPARFYRIKLGPPLP